MTAELMTQRGQDLGLEGVLLPGSKPGGQGRVENGVGAPTLELGEKADAVDVHPPGALRGPLNVEPPQSIFIDDFVQNVEGARQIGMAAIHFSPRCDLSTVLYKWLDSKVPR